MDYDRITIPMRSVPVSEYTLDKSIDNCQLRPDPVDRVFESGRRAFTINEMSQGGRGIYKLGDMIPHRVNRI